MYLTEPNRLDVVQKQYRYKLKVCEGMLSALMVTQIVALLFSLGLGGVGMMRTTDDTVSVTLRFYSGDVVLIFTMIWSLIIGITLTTKPYRNMDFTFVSTRLTNHLSNLALLLTSSAAGGTTAILSGYLLKVLIYFFHFGNPRVIGTFITAQELLTGWVAACFYVFLLSMLGYFVGMLVQMSKAFLFILPAILVGTLILGIRLPFVWLTNAFIHQSSLAWFAGEVVLLSAILFLATIGVSRRWEVRTWE